MYIEFFEEVLTITNDNGKRPNCFSTIYDKLNLISDNAKQQLMFLLDLNLSGNFKLTETNSVWLIKGPNYRLSLLKDSLDTTDCTIVGIYNNSELLNMNYCIKDDFTAVVYAGEVIAILPYSIEA